MALTSGFYNSYDGDRKYTATQLSDLFSNLITDGVLMNYGDAFSVTANGTNNTVIVGSGRSWFNNIWALNDADLSIELSESGVLDRYDAVALTINKSVGTRAVSIDIVTGQQSVNPVYPTLTLDDENEIWQYPLAYIFREANSTAISQANVEYKVGTTECPFITGILETISTDAMLAQWEDEFTTWFDNLHAVLDTDVATHLQNEIEALQNWQNSFVGTHYPIGKLIFSTENVNPGTYLTGTTWELWGSGKVPVGVDPNDTDFNAAEKTGGEKSHTLTVDELPTHNHTLSVSGTAASAGEHTHTTTDAGGHTHTATTASNGNHTHTATTSSAGGHSHTANSGGAHTHSISGKNGSATYAFTGQSVNLGSGLIVGYYHNTTLGGWTLQANSAGAHTHSTTTNGAHTHTLTTSNTGAHTHTLTTTNNGTHSHTANKNGAHTHVLTISGTSDNTGSDSAHNNMPPYITCYIWKRVA